MVSDNPTFHTKLINTLYIPVTQMSTHIDIHGNDIPNGDAGAFGAVHGAAGEGQPLLRLRLVWSLFQDRFSILAPRVHALNFPFLVLEDCIVASHAGICVPF